MNMILLIIGTVFAGLWAFFFLLGVGNKKYAGYIAQLTNSMFLLSDLYFIGYAVLDLFHIKTDNGFMGKNQKKFSELFEAKYARFYNRALWAGKITLALTIIPVMVFTGVIAGEPIIGWLGIVVGPVMAMSLDNSVVNRVTARREEILMDFPQVISKLAMLINAGMTLNDAWQQVAFSGHALSVADDAEQGENVSAIYREMQTATLEIQRGGKSAEQAYMDFATRCNVPEVRKFASLVIQNMKKGGSDMVFALQEMANERWQQKKHLVLRKGEMAGNQLLMPIMLMFVGVLLLIMVPAMSSLTV